MGVILFPAGWLRLLMGVTRLDATVMWAIKVNRMFFLPTPLNGLIVKPCCVSLSVHTTRPPVPILFFMCWTSLSTTLAVWTILKQLEQMAPQRKTLLLVLCRYLTFGSCTESL